MTKTKKAMSGISTLIIFIALILVAAVAALVLLQTVGSLQSQALATGKSKQQVSTAIQISNVIGWIDRTNNKIGYMRIGLNLAPGSDKVNLSRTYLSYSDGNSYKTGLDYNQTNVNENTDSGAQRAADVNAYTVEITGLTAIEKTSVGSKYTILFLGQGSNYSTKTTIDPQTSVEMYFRTGALSTDTKVRLSVDPVGGNGVEVSFRTPSSFDANTLFVKLYP